MTRVSAESRDDWQAVSDRVCQWTLAAGRTVFGDRYGLVLFLGTLAFVMSYWRIGVFITDSYAVANALVNVADGHFAVTEMQYSLSLRTQPGLFVAGDSVYGRNYAHVFLALPLLWLFEGLAALLDPRLVIAAAWSGVLLGFTDQLGRVIDRHRQVALGGAVLAVLAFLGNVVVATPLPRKWLAFASLQVVTMLATAFTGVVLYRVLADAHDRRVGLLVGTAVVVASPLGFWASIPKRHALSAFAVVLALGVFYFARTADADRRARRLRGLSYGVVALFAWLHPLEALALLGALVPVDLVTATSNRPRDLVVVGLVFLVALTPFLLTNLAISGNPLQPPRLLDQYDGEIDPFDRASAGSGGGAEKTPTPTPTPDPTASPSGTTGQGGSTATPPTATAGGATPSPSPPQGPLGGLVSIVLGIGSTLLDTSLRASGRAWSFLGGGITVVTQEPERLYHTFVRSGRIPSVAYSVSDQEATDLALLEVAPLLGGLLGTVAVGVRRGVEGRSVEKLRTSLGSPERQTDLLAIAAAGLFVLVNMDRLPLRAQITVRYLLPVVPLGLYGLGRFGAVHRIVRIDWQWLVGSYLCVCAVGSVTLVVVHVWLDLAVGEAMQFHALLGLGSAVSLVCWTLLEGAGYQTDNRIGAVVLAIPAAVSTVFLLFTGFAYFRYAEYALGAIRIVAGWLPIPI